MGYLAACAPCFPYRATSAGELGRVDIGRIGLSAVTPTLVATPTAAVTPTPLPSVYFNDALVARVVRGLGTRSGDWMITYEQEVTDAYAGFGFTGAAADVSYTRVELTSPVTAGVIRYGIRYYNDGVARYANNAVWRLVLLLDGQVVAAQGRTLYSPPTIGYEYLASFELMDISGIVFDAFEWYVDNPKTADFTRVYPESRLDNVTVIGAAGGAGGSGELVTVPPLCREPVYSNSEPLLSNPVLSNGELLTYLSSSCFGLPSIDLSFADLGSTPQFELCLDFYALPTITVLGIPISADLLLLPVAFYLLKFFLFS
ncbi:MAG: hypothetical protein D6712_16705 [Chloroflexi bacterium]|nr:MAG: hypothetical protein D6712_16705 [Chloroflexota bacterium]